MRRKMTLLFKMGITVIVVIAVVLFYCVHDDHVSSQSAEKRNQERLVVVSDESDVLSGFVGDALDEGVDVDAKLIDQGLKDESNKVKYIYRVSETQNGVPVKTVQGEKSKDSEKSVKNLLDSNPVLNANLEEVAKNIRLEEDTETQQRQMVSKDPENLKSVKNVAEPSKEELQQQISSGNPSVFQDKYVHLSVVACGDRLEETMVMLKSAVLQAIKPLRFHIFAESGLHSQFNEELERWPEYFRHKVIYDIHPITFPEGENAQEWKKLFKPCASQRLFLPLILKTIDALLYVDTDILFMRPIDDVWAHFEKFNSSHIAALAPEHEDAAAGWYNRFARHPYYGKLGVNSGVMLMNLTRLREMDFVKIMIDYYKIYKYNITWGDQDLINVLFHNYPEKLYVYQCDWNYRPDHCMYMSVCKDAEHNGASVIHGSRQTFHNDKQPSFKAVYNAFDKFKMGNDLTGLVTMMKQLLKETSETQCGKVANIFTDQLERHVKGRRVPSA